MTTAFDNVIVNTKAIKSRLSCTAGKLWAIPLVIAGVMACPGAASPPVTIADRQLFNSLTALGKSVSSLGKSVSALGDWASRLTNYTHTAVTRLDGQLESQHHDIAALETEVALLEKQLDDEKIEMADLKLRLRQ